MTGRVDGGHARGDVSDGLVVSILEADIAIRGLDLPSLGSLHGLERVLYQLLGCVGAELQTRVFDFGEGFGQAEDLPVHMCFLLI